MKHKSFYLNVLGLLDRIVDAAEIAKASTVRSELARNGVLPHASDKLKAAARVFTGL